MRARSHSRTAEVTAAIRAFHHRYDTPLVFDDPFAVHLTSTLWRTIGRFRWLHNLVINGLFKALRPVHGWILARDRITQQCLEQFVDTHRGQFVLLGAGFDTTVLRKPPWLKGTAVFEIDHPRTQAVKLKRIKRVDIVTDPLDFESIAVDLEQRRLHEVMSTSSFDPQRLSFFAWQGVIYYLTEDAIQRTLVDVAELAAPGSELIFDFLLPNADIRQRDRKVQRFAKSFTSRLGEHYISFHTLSDIKRMARDAGFEVIHIYEDEAINRTYFDARKDGLSAMRGFGIAHLRRTASD